MKERVENQVKNQIRKRNIVFVLLMTILGFCAIMLTISTILNIIIYKNQIHKTYKIHASMQIDHYTYYQGLNIYIFNIRDFGVLKLEFNEDAFNILQNYNYNFNISNNDLVYMNQHVYSNALARIVYLGQIEIHYNSTWFRIESLNNKIDKDFIKNDTFVFSL